MLGVLRVNVHTKNNYFAPKCLKIRFSHFWSKKITICNKKVFRSGFLTLKMPDLAIASDWQGGKYITDVLRHITAFGKTKSQFDHIFDIYGKFLIDWSQF